MRTFLLSLTLVSFLSLASNDSQLDYKTSTFRDGGSFSMVFICLHIGKKFSLIDDYGFLVESIRKKFNYEKSHMKNLFGDADIYWNDFKSVRSASDLHLQYWKKMCEAPTNKMRASFKK